MPQKCPHFEKNISENTCLFTLIKHYDMVQESSTCGLKTVSTVIENLNTLNEHHLLIFFNKSR